MRSLHFLLCSMLAFCLSLNAQSVDKKIADALGEIYQGFVQHGVSELQKSANANSSIAQYYMAVCYESGIGVNQNPKEAFYLFRKAAERGLPNAMSRIATYYQEGEVVEKNESKYIEWSDRYKKKGGALQLPDLVTIYNEGIKHPENYAINPNASNFAQDNGGNVGVQQVINNITVVQQAPAQPVVENPITKKEPQPQRKKSTVSDIDKNIPTVSQNNELTFVLIIANEDYQDVAKVPNAVHDGEVFFEYCNKTLGIPTTNIHFVKNATLNNMKREVNLINQIASAYNGTAKFIVYYAGHGVPDESSHKPYILPVDGYISDLSTCYSLSDLYITFGKMNTSQIVVLLDACFSGSQRDDKMLASARGVAIKAKTGAPADNTIVLSASQGDETAYAYKEQGHGMFSYFLMKKLQETKGDVTLGDLSAFIKDNVMKKSLVANGKQQTPSVNASAAIQDKWKTWKLK